MEVAKRTHQKSVVLESSSKSEVILKEALGKTSRWTSTRLAYAQAVEKRGVKGVSCEARRRLSRPKGVLKAKSAWDAYKRLHWRAGVRPGTPEAQSEHKRLRKQWEREEPHVRRHMQWVAAARIVAAREADAASSTIVDVQGIDIGGINARTTTKRKVFQ